MSKFDDIRRQHIVSAFKGCARDGWPTTRTSDTYFAYFEGEFFPPKYIVSRAQFFATGRERPSDNFNAHEARDLLRRFKYLVIDASVRDLRGTAEDNRVLIGARAIYVLNSVKGLDTMRCLKREEIAESGASFKKIDTSSPRCHAYRDAYALIFTALTGGPAPVLGDKAVTNSLIADGYLRYHAGPHQLTPGHEMLALGDETPTRFHGLTRYRAVAAPPLPASTTSMKAKKRSKSNAQKAARVGHAGAPTLQASEVAEDITAIFEDQSLKPTTRKALIDARIGQGNFRRDVMALWNSVCAVTGCPTEAALRASHIKPWRDSGADERLDPENGLLLSANLDALFDRALVSFDDEGKLLISLRLNQNDRKTLPLNDGALRHRPSPRMRAYLAEHRKGFERQEYAK